MAEVCFDQLGRGAQQGQGFVYRASMGWTPAARAAVTRSAPSARENA